MCASAPCQNGMERIQINANCHARPSQCTDKRQRQGAARGSGKRKAGNKQKANVQACRNPFSSSAFSRSGRRTPPSKVPSDLASLVLGKMVVARRRYQTKGRGVRHGRFVAGQVGEAHVGIALARHTPRDLSAALFLLVRRTGRLDVLEGFPRRQDHGEGIVIVRAHHTVQATVVDAGHEERRVITIVRSQNGIKAIWIPGAGRVAGRIDSLIDVIQSVNEWLSAFLGCGMGRPRRNAC
jgi:hypothetical protein